MSFHDGMALAMAADVQQVKKDEELTRLRKHESDATVRWAECLCGKEVSLQLACHAKTSRGGGPRRNILIFEDTCECGRNMELQIEVLG